MKPSGLQQSCGQGLPHLLRWLPRAQRAKQSRHLVRQVRGANLAQHGEGLTILAAVCRRRWPCMARGCSSQCTASAVWRSKLGASLVSEGHEERAFRYSGPFGDPGPLQRHNARSVVCACIRACMPAERSHVSLRRARQFHRRHRSVCHTGPAAGSRFLQSDTVVARPRKLLRDRLGSVTGPGSQVRRAPR